MAGGGGGLFDAITTMGAGMARNRAAQRSAGDARYRQRQGMDLFQSQRRDPELVSKHIGPYQRSQSPVADAFLQSLLTGQNRAAVQGTRAGAPGQQRAAQRGFDASTGGFDALRERQAAMQEETPWAVRGFNRDMTGLGGTASTGESREAMYQRLLRSGWAPNEALVAIRDGRAGGR